MEQQVVSEIDDLFQELIVEKITKRINDINNSLDSLLGEESEIRYRLNQIPTNGGVRTIVSEQLKSLNEQAGNISDKLVNEQHRLSGLEDSIKKWLLQLATHTKEQLDDTENHLKDYSETKETAILESINRNAIDAESNITSSLENVRSSISSEISKNVGAVDEHLDLLFLDEQSDASFRKHFDSNIQMLFEKLSDCQDLLAQIYTGIGEISTNTVTGNAFMEETKSAVSSLVEKSDTFSQKSDIAELLKAIDENTMHISAISNTDVLEELKLYKIETDARLDYFKKANLFLIVINLLTLLTLISMIAFSVVQ